MKLSALLDLIYLFIWSDVIASGIGAFMAWRYRKYNGVSSVMRAIAVLLAALCFEGTMQLIARGFGYEIEPVFSMGYAWSSWTGRAVRSAALWAFVLKFLDKK